MYQPVRGSLLIKDHGKHYTEIDAITIAVTTLQCPTLALTIEMENKLIGWSGNFFIIYNVFSSGVL